MIRIIFDNGELMECENINKIYIDEEDMDKISPVYSNPCESCIFSGLSGMPNEDSFECLCCKGEETHD